MGSAEGAGSVGGTPTVTSVPSSPGTTSRKHLAGPQGKESTLPAGSGHTSSSALASKEVLSTTTSSIPLLTRSFLGKQQSQFNIKKLKTGALAGNYRQMHENCAQIMLALN